MSKPVKNDTPDQGYLFDSYNKADKERIAKGNESNDWLADIIDQERIGLAKIFKCNPDTCTDDCNKCRIFGGR